MGEVNSEESTKAYRAGQGKGGKKKRQVPDARRKEWDRTKRGEKDLRKRSNKWGDTSGKNRCKGEERKFTSRSVTVKCREKQDSTIERVGGQLKSTDRGVGRKKNWMPMRKPMTRSVFVETRMVKAQQKRKLISLTKRRGLGTQFRGGLERI